MTFSDRTHIEAENMAKSITCINQMRHQLKPIDPETIDTPEIPLSQPTHVSRTEEVYLKYPEPAQETAEERAWRHQQIDYERMGSFDENVALAKSINLLADHNFTNRVLAAACDFTEMAEHHPRAPFIRNFGPLIEEELKENPQKPSKRLASFATTYFWKEANWARLASAVRPDTTRAELVEFFELPLNSEPNKKVADFLPERIMGKIITSTKDQEAWTIPLKKERAYLPLDETEKMIQSIKTLSKQNFTNRILTSTAYFDVLCNPFHEGRTIKNFGKDLEKELKENPNKASPILVTALTEKHLDDEDVKVLIDGVTPQTTKKELSEFFETRENWSTGLRMIDYLNHHVVTEMARFLPDQDKLALWSLKPEMVYDFNAAESLRKFSTESQQKILDSIQDPNQKRQIQENMDNRLIGLHVSIGLMGGGCPNPNTLDIPGRFATIRKRRICSHTDNKRFFAGPEYSR